MGVVVVHVTQCNDVVDCDGKWFVIVPCRVWVRWVERMA